MTQLRAAVHVLGVCGLLFAAGMPPNAAARGKTRCRGVESNASGAGLVTTIPLKFGGRRYHLEVRSAGALGEPRTSSFTVTTGRRTLLRAQATGSPDGFTLNVDLGNGVRGARHIELASADGRTVTGTVDGRALAPFTVEGNTAPDFVDGGTVPKLKMKPLLRGVLRKLAKLAVCAGQESPATPASSPGTPTPQALISSFLSSCDLCNMGCGLAFMVCGGSALLSAAAGVGIPTLALNIANCEDALFKCTSACVRGKACCPVPCAGGHGIALGNNVCEATCSEGAVCCGGPDNPNGQCCGGGGSTCCGYWCIDAGDRCLNPNTGAFCYGAFPGDVCSDTSQAGPAFCCDSSKPVCRDATQHVCCASNAGELCDIDGGIGCCPPDRPYCSRGNAAGCCAEPVCCDPPSSKCGSACCNPFTEVCGDPNQSLCVESPPEVVIDQPTPGAQLFEGVPVTLSGHDVGLGICQFHPQNGHWSSDGMSDVVPQSGCTVSAKFIGTGPRTLTFKVIGPHGTPGSKSVTVTVVPKPPVFASIVSPAANQSFSYPYGQILLEASAGGQEPLTYTWVWQADAMGCAPFTIAPVCPKFNIECVTQPPQGVTFLSYWDAAAQSPPCTGTGQLKLTVTDALNQTAAAIPVPIYLVPRIN
jgi:hypothetical protein